MHTATVTTTQADQQRVLRGQIHRFREVDLDEIGAFALWLAKDPARLDMPFTEASNTFDNYRWRTLSIMQRGTFHGHGYVCAHVSRLGRRLTFDTLEGLNTFCHANHQLCSSISHQINRADRTILI